MNDFIESTNGIQNLRISREYIYIEKFIRAAEFLFSARKNKRKRFDVRESWWSFWHPALARRALFFLCLKVVEWNRRCIFFTMTTTTTTILFYCLFQQWIKCVRMYVCMPLAFSKLERWTSSGSLLVFATNSEEGEKVFRAIIYIRLGERFACTEKRVSKAFMNWPSIRSGKSLRLQAFFHNFINHLL